MRTLLRHISSGQYFESLDKWTPDREQAHDFGPVARAVKFAHKAGLDNTELVLSFETSERVALPRFEQLRIKGRA